MKKYFLIIGLIIFVGWIIYNFYPSFQKSSQEANNLQPSSKTNAQVNPQSTLQSTQQNNVGIGESRAYRERKFLEVYQTPINFWGKVIDEKGNPVADALATFGANDKPGETGSSYERKSDPNGLFSITGIKGRSLSVRLSKEGYYSYSNSQGQLDYYSLLPNEHLLPTPNNPAIFILRKMGETEPLIKVEERSFRIPKDGTLVGVDLTNGRTIIEGKSNIITVSCLTEDQIKDEEGHYNWRCKITVPGGGLLPRKNEFDFIAPEEGYQPFDEINMPKSLHGREWSKRGEREYFAKLENGNFARFKFRITTGGDHFFVIESYLNPNGSRNLEYDENKQINP